MRKVAISNSVIGKIGILKSYLVSDLNLSESAAMRRIDRIGEFLSSLSAPVNYLLCRFKRWCALGYRCAVFEKDWIFAYEVLNGGIIIRDMSHTSVLCASGRAQ